MLWGIILQIIIIPICNNLYNTWKELKVIVFPIRTSAHWEYLKNNNFQQGANYRHVIFWMVATMSGYSYVMSTEIDLKNLYLLGKRERGQTEFEIVFFYPINIKSYDN